MSFPIAPFPEQHYLSYGGGDEGKKPIVMENFVSNTSITTTNQNTCYVTGYYTDGDGESRNVTGFIKAILDECDLPQLRYGFDSEARIGNPDPSIIPRQSFSYSIEDEGSTLTAEVILGSFRMAPVYERGFFLFFNVPGGEMTIDVRAGVFENTPYILFFDSNEEEKIKELEAKGYRF